MKKLQEESRLRLAFPDRSRVPFLPHLWELYDLKADPTEMNNLAGERPEKTKELAQMWEKWNAGSVGKR